MRRSQFFIPPGQFILSVDNKRGKVGGKLINLFGLIENYAILSKFKLTCMVLSTTLAGFLLQDPSSAFMPSTSLLYCILGTGLCSASASSFNQIFEHKYDALMIRTRNRPIPQGLLSKTHASIFSITSAAMGLSILAIKSNMLSAGIAAITIGLYAFVYTPLKRSTIANTSIGAIVGALPPLIGYTTCTGTLDVEGILLGALLYCWQFPHFNSLSYSLMEDYKRAGYCMSVNVKPVHNRIMSLLHAFMLIPINNFLLDFTWWNLPLDILMLWKAQKYWKNPSKDTAKNLFLYSLLYLPLSLIIIIGYKKLKTKSLIESNKNNAS